MRLFSSIFVVLFCVNLNAQTTFTTTPQYPTETDQITITFDVTNSTPPSGKGSLKNYSGNVYAYTCVFINNGNTWLYEKWKWNNNDAQSLVTPAGTNKYQFVINNPRTFYGVSSSDKITSLNFVLRSSDGNKQTENIYIPLYSPGISIILNSPAVNNSYGDPLRSPVFVSSGSTLPISVTTTVAGTIKLFINENPITQSSTNALDFDYIADDYLVGKNDIKITAADNANHKDSTLFVIFKNPTIQESPLPYGCRIGINYNRDPSKVTLAFYAPKKSFVYVVGDFGTSDWKVDTSYFMNRHVVKSDSVIWWTIISNLEAGKEYSYQFLVDGELRIYDPYTEKILDGNNDKDIPPTVYPNLKEYPTGKTTGLVSVVQTNQPTYNWNALPFTRPDKEKLVIYEILVRDFVGTHWYKTIMDTLSYLKRLGITAIELMPITEFEANDSWGYNPSTFFAPDKYYGTKNDLKALIDACHQNGIAVILDIVLNHAYNSNSMAQLYWDSINNRPAADNPWFNVTSPNTSFSWGNDFNHESKDTKYFVDRVTNFWLTEYKIDGFRFDFTKGFTNAQGDGWAKDDGRITILKRIADKIWSVSPDAYVILEHLTENSEEMELANYGMMLWGNNNYNYNEATMGFISTSNFNNVSYKQRGWQFPRLVGYMESHDEERLMYKNITYGNFVGYSSSNPTVYNPTKDASGNIIYSIREQNTALSRMQMAANLFILVPGPKMIWQFGELGYDYSRDYQGKLTAKPIRWDYYSNDNRRALFYTYAYLNNLKTNYPAFSSTDFTLTASLTVKSLYINYSLMNVAVFGNFGITPQDYQASFQSAGDWYEFFTGDTLFVSNVNMNINLQPGEFRLYTSQKINKTDVVTSIKTNDSIPASFNLSQNYPNPFNPVTTIKYFIPSAETQNFASQQVTMKVYDFLGREIAALVNGVKSPGIHSVQFDAHNLPSGIYFYRLQAGKYISTKKMVLIK